MKTRTSAVVEFRMPHATRIGSGAKQLYKLEEQLRELIHKIAEERGKYLEMENPDFFRESLPQVLFDIMDGYQDESVELACIASLERLGWTQLGTLWRKLKAEGYH